jgi:hypothetical protein
MKRLILGIFVAAAVSGCGQKPQTDCRQVAKWVGEVSACYYGTSIKRFDGTEKQRHDERAKCHELIGELPKTHEGRIARSLANDFSEDFYHSKAYQSAYAECRKFESGGGAL